MSISNQIVQLESKGIYLWKENGRLKYRAKEGAMSPEIMNWLKTNKAEIIQELQNTTGLTHDEQHRYEPFPLTAMQNSYVVGRNAEYMLGGTGCHSYVEFKMAEIDCGKMEQAWHMLIQRHDMLRAVFTEDRKQQVLEYPILPKLTVHDFSKIPQEKAEKEFLAVRRQLERRDYIIGKWPMHAFEVSVLPQYSILHFSVDMLISDFVSVNIMMTEMLKFYQNPKEKLPVPQITYRDFVMEEQRRQQEEKEGAAYREAKVYWQKKVAGMGGAPQLPIQEQTDTEEVSFTRHFFRLEKEKWEAVKSFAKEYGITPSAAVMTVYIETISRWSANFDFCINLTLMDRNRDFLTEQNIVGDFTTVNVFGVQAKQESFLSRVKRNQRELMKDLQHKNFSGIDVLKELSRQRAEQVMIPVVYTSTLGTPQDDTISENAEMIYGVSRTPQVWIDCQTIESAGEMIVNWDVRDGIFDETTLNEMFCAMQAAMEKLADSPSVWQEQTVVALPRRTVTVREEINRTEQAIPTRFLYDGFLNQVKNNPERTALIAAQNAYTYRQLSGYVQAVAEELHRHKIASGSKILILEEKGIWQVAAVLAVLLIGGVYVPVAPHQPRARKESILKDADAVCVIGKESFEDCGAAWINPEKLQPTEAFDLEGDLQSTENTAYIIFTSGSTGRPKGVVVSHDAAMNTIEDINRRFRITSEDCILGVSALTFDLSVYDLFGAFAAGAVLVLPDMGKEKSPAHWCELIRKYHVTVWNSVPALMAMLLDYKKSCESDKKMEMKCILLSGDLIPRTFPAEIKKSIVCEQVYSLGGATEAAIWSIYYPITHYEENKNIPYGIPLANQQFYVLNQLNELCPDGVIGELCIGGRGLAKAYYGDEILTGEKFFVHPEIGERIYRTGDLGRYRTDGVLEFIGRKDFQVKVNGHRIELGEVEYALQQHPNVDKAAAAVFTTAEGRKSLEAFVVPKQNTTSVLNYAKISEALQKEVEKTANEALRGHDRKGILEWKQCSEKTAVIDMLHVFWSVGLFDVQQPNRIYTLQEIMMQLQPHPDFEHIVKRWLNVLVKEELLAKPSAEQYQLTEKASQQKSREQVWIDFEQTEEKVHYSRKLFDYQKKSSDLLLNQIRGVIRGLDLFFPKGETGIAEAAYRTNIVNDTLNRVVSKAMNTIVDAKHKRLHRPIRILEVGAGVGGTTYAVVAGLADCSVSYHFTDVSQFFINKAKEAYQNYPFMTYGIFDMNQDFQKQLASDSYDVILCANVLHNAKNCPQVLENLKKILTANGILLMIDTTADSYSLLTSLELKGGLSDFTDMRQNREQTFFSEADWLQMFSDAKFQDLISYPTQNDLLNEIGQKVMIYAANITESEIDENEIRRFLQNYLPGYMIPHQVKALRELPLNANGKIDRKKLKSMQPSEAVRTDTVQDSGNQKEQIIAEIWKDILKLKEVGLQDNFYAVGGDSLLIAQVVTRIKEEIPSLKDMNWDDLMREILKNPTISGIAKILEQTEAVPQETEDAAKDPYHDSRCMHIYQQGTGKAVTAFFHAGTGRIRDYTKIAPAFCERQKERTVVGFTYGDEELYTMMPPEDLLSVRAQVYANRLMELNADRYQLAGYCVGGFIAMETAKVLMEHGCNVEPVVAISSHLCLHRIHNQMLMECAYGVVLGADVYRAGYRGDVNSIRRALESILKGENRNVENEELCALSEEFSELGQAFTQLSRFNHEERMQKIYESIDYPDFNGAESTVSMLNILYRIFDCTYQAMIHYQPDFFTGDVIVLIPDEELPTSYPAMIPDTDWEEFVLGNVEKHIVHGNHNTCIEDGRIEQILQYLVAADGNQ